MKYILYYLLFFVVILMFAYINTPQDTPKKVEHFTPAINQLYRPLVRNTRVIGEGFYNKSTSNISNLFRKFGIM